MSRAGLVLSLLVPLAVRAAEPEAACPPGTALREHAQEFACATPDGVGEGPFWALRDDGTVQYRGAARGGRTHGTWTSWHANGVRSKQAEYRDGVLVGDFRQWDEQGRRLYAGRHDARGEMDGTWTRWWPNGRKRTEWEMRHGSPHGAVAAWWESGARKLRGRREAGRREGRWTWWDEAGSVAAQCRYESGAVVDGRCGAEAPD
ncbi:MAG: hypothetical protein DCC71_05980 [Proteobacteria bacterium]|nr:MAG: hypothetical protein DCC71_05980 [Pseudomonadota bacterium]